MKQLSLFSLDELAECYLATKVVQKVRASLRKPSNVIKFPIKKYLDGWARLPTYRRRTRRGKN